MVEGSPRIGAPVGVVPKFFGIGLNYRDHAEETGLPIPEVPIVFAKASSCVSGPYDPDPPAERIRSHGFRGRARGRDRHSREERV